MADKSAIEWTDATWNPVTGCTKITRGCDFCYAERFAERFRGTPGHPFEQGFDLKLRPERLEQPLSWRQPRMIFVNSMSDLFHKKVPADFIDKVFDTMEQADWHIFQVLTKRSSLMKNYLQRRYGKRRTPPHIWCGVSIEDAAAAARVRHLQQAPIAVRFLSIEPLLGPINRLSLRGISWVIVGGESGPKARPMQEEWALRIRDLCQKRSVPFFFKQWGGLTPKTGGRLLDGVEYNAVPITITERGRNSMSQNDRFHWSLEDGPPEIESHSKAKLDVLRSYLRAYFDTLGSHFARDEFKLDLVDGFAGGGTFLDGNKTISGTPLIMLEEAEEAKKRLSHGRNKPLNFDLNHYFIDVEKVYTEHLRKVLGEKGYEVDNEKVVILNKKFADAVDDVINNILRRQPKAGRSIFLLDQTGYTQVELSLVRRIFDRLPRAEVILTFAADMLINLLSEKTQLIMEKPEIGLTTEKIQRMLQEKEGYNGKAVVQRTLREHIRIITGATYDTPFFIRPKGSRRALWFIHLSRHPTARDVMIQRHWENRSTFEHYGTGGFGMLGWDPLDPFKSEKQNTFNFGKSDRQKMLDQLLNTLPDKLSTLTSQGPITIEAIRYRLANQIAARYSDLDEILLQLFSEKEINIIDPDDKLRSQRLKKIKPTDRIVFPDQPLIIEISRRR